MHLLLPDELLDEGNVHQRCVGVDKLEHESLGDQIVFVRGVRSVIFLKHNQSPKVSNKRLGFKCHPVRGFS